MSQSQESVRLSPRRSPRSPSFPTASKTDVPDTPSILAFQRCLRHFLYILYQSMGRFPELTPVRSQTTRPWLSTLDAGDSRCDKHTAVVAVAETRRGDTMSMRQWQWQQRT